MQETTLTKRLSDKQLEHFNENLLSDHYLVSYLKEYCKHFDGETPISVLDVGGGNGEFADSLIARFPNVQVTVLDNSEYMLSLNKPHPRKRLVLGSATDPKAALKEEQFDLITINWVLHHLIGNSYQSTLSLMELSLRELKHHLTPKGFIAITENFYAGIVIDSLPSKLIYTITSIRQPFLVSIIRKGFNTAGVGVCFITERILNRLTKKAGLRIVSSVNIATWTHLKWYARFILHSRHMRLTCTWVEAVPKTPEVDK